MQLIEELYLGWTPFTHLVNCPSPTWDVAEVRHDVGTRPVRTDAEDHACPTEGCDHSNTVGRARVRLLCRDCDTVYTLTAEGLGAGCSTTSLTGWGQPPRQTGGVWLWPGQPTGPEQEPHDYLVTRDHTAAVTPSNLYGLITRYRDTDGAPRWIAGAHPDPDGAFQVHSLRFRYRSGGLPNLAAAARWVADAETRAHRPVVVNV
jgi:hypothetical protein